ERVAKAYGAYRKVKGAFHVDPFQFTGECHSESASRLRITLRGDANDPRVVTMILNAGKGWNIYNGEILPFDAKIKTRMARSTYVDKVSGLVTLLRDKDYTLTLKGEAKVHGAPAVQVQVRFAGMPDVQLF